MQTSISLDVSSELTREPIEAVAARDPDSPAGSGRLPDQIRRIRLQNLPIAGVDFIDADRDEIVPVRDLEARTATFDAVDADRLLVSTTGTSGTDLRLLLEGESERAPSSREPMTVHEPEPATDGGPAPAPAGGVLIAVDNGAIVGGIAGAALGLALAGIATDSRSVALGVGIGAATTALGVGAGAVGAFDV